MALFDESQDNIVIRIVYVGPPFAGKTESLRMLSQILRGKSDGQLPYSPSDAYGRTLYFDWFDHCAGLFRGRPIRCQIIAVPGQTTLTERRKMLVDMADCIVFVADSTPARWTKNREFLDEIIPWLKGPQPPIAMVFQLNKQDRSSAYTVDAFRKVLTELNYPNPVIRPSSATTGDGLRETFITAVSLALDRVHALIEVHALQACKILDISDGKQLFDLMIQREQEASKTPTALRFQAAARDALGSDPQPVSKPEDRPSSSDRIDAPVSTVWNIRGQSLVEQTVEAVPAPKPPMGPARDSDRVMMSLMTHVVAGGIYPPVHGRERMYAAIAGLRPPELRPDGSWFVRTAEWRIRSTRTESFDGLASARQHLLALAQTCESLKNVMARERFIAVTEAGDGRYLVWQGIKAGLSAEESLRDGALQSDTLRCTTLLFVIAMRLRQMLACAANRAERLVLSLDNMMMHEEELVYSGFLDEPKAISIEARPLMEQFAHILDPHLRTWPEVRRAEVGDLLSGKLRVKLARNEEQQATLEAVVALLGRSMDHREVRA